MVDERLVAFVKKEVEKNTPEALLKKKLKETGWSDKDISDAMRETKAHSESKKEAEEKPKHEAKKSDNKFVGFFVKIWEILAKPKKFFSDAADEQIKSPIAFFSILIGIVAVLSLVIAITTTEPGIFTGIYFMYSILYVLLFIAIMYVVLALYVLITFGLVKLFKGKSGAAETTKAMLYGTTPSMLLGWIPYVQYAAWTWSLVLQGYGLAKLHELSWWKALLVILIPLLLLICAVLLYLYYYPTMILGTNGTF